MKGIDFEHLEAMLTRLKLTAIRDRLDNLLDQASKQNLSMAEALVMLCEAEIERKDQRRISMHMGLAKFPVHKTIEGFDFSAQPSIDRSQIETLATGRFIASADNLLLLGPPGVGKTHLGVAIGREAVLRGYSTLFTTAVSLVASLSKAQTQGRLPERMNIYVRPKLLIIDELGYLPFERDAANLFFQLISARYEKGATLITSNRAAYEWGEVFSDDVIATAILDRLLHHAHVITIKGESYRLKEKRRTGLIRRSETDPRASKPEDRSEPESNTAQL